MSPEESRLLVAESSAEALRLSVSSIDLRNGGRARSEHVLDDLFFTLVGLADPALFVEAGAKDAPASLRVADERPGVTVIACEANPRLQRHFAEALGHAQRGVDYRATALSDAPGTVTLHVPEIGDDFTGGLAGTSSLLSSGPAESPFGDEVVRTEVQVDATTLDALGREVPQGRVALWVDVEGAAEQVLHGVPGPGDVVGVDGGVALRPGVRVDRHDRDRRAGQGGRGRDDDGAVDQRAGQA